MKTCWVLTNGYAGIINQALGLAEHLPVHIIHKKVTLRPFWHLLSPYVTLGKKFCMAKESDPLTTPWPDLVIASGRQAILPALYIKEASRGGTKIIYLQEQNRFFKEESEILYKKMINLQKEIIKKTGDEGLKDVYFKDEQNIDFSNPLMLAKIKERNNSLEKYNRELQEQNKKLMRKKKIIYEKNLKELELLGSLNEQLKNYSEVLKNELDQEKQSNLRNTVLLINLEQKIKTYDEKIRSVQSKYNDVQENIKMIENMPKMNAVDDSFRLEES
ncbi:MAG: mitochondrial fission ELM1 family protein, partial [Alphaproteobacteria bacterium]|nr:mitochondrial fission ELM1 family protein [Alphaproteobacteria bacterium]